MLSFSDACERNKDPILLVLRDVLANAGSVLEIGSGTGQHAVHFARNMPHLVWQSSDLAENLPAINQRLATEGPDNALQALALDVSDEAWPVSSADAVFSANALHIMSWQQVEHFYRGVGEVLAGGGVLCVYGPFRYGDAYSSESNAVFDRHLKQRDPSSGIRDFEAVDRLAQARGFQLFNDYPMPANNQTLVWNKR